MKRLAISLLGISLLAGCAARTPAPATGGTFTGQVWTWDEDTNVVTLRQVDGKLVRVQLTPDEIRRLQLHQNVTLRGQLAPPAEITTVVTPPPALVPEGSADRTEITGNVGAVDPAGKLSLSGARGPVQVWVTSNTSFRAGEPVRVRMQVQPLQPAPAGSGTQPVAALEPSASPSTEPGDYAVVIGRIQAVDPAGRLTVESPRGPIEVLVPNAARYRTGQSVEVRSSVHPAR